MTSSVGSADDYHASLTGRTRLSRHRVPEAGTAAGVTCLTARAEPVASRYRHARLPRAFPRHSSTSVDAVPGRRRLPGSGHLTSRREQQSHGHSHIAAQSSADLSPGGQEPS